MQNISIIGRVGKSAEVKEFNSNQVINFSVAVSETYKDKQGEKQTTTTWFEVSKWGNNTAIAPYIKQGDNIYVSGKVNNRAYTNKDGEIVVANGINAFEIELLGSKGDNSNSAPAPQQPASASNYSSDLPEDDLPF